ncbi:MAG: hypothetical protein U9Q68_08400 [Euryarchaeota archaeon]|nr:hypothetical protein [Euryarchaeota archaeon]
MREKLEKIVTENDLLDETVVIRAKPLTPEEAIGNPESEDFPILKGVERLMRRSLQDALVRRLQTCMVILRGRFRTFLLWNLTTTTEGLSLLQR